MANRYVGRRVRAALRGAARLRGHRPASSTPPRSQPITCPFTGEQLTAVPALQPGRRDHPRAARRPRRATCSCGGSSACRRRRCSRPRRSLVTVEEIVDELEPRAGRGRAAVLGGHLRGRGARRRAPLLRAGLLRARQRLLPRWDAISRDRDAFGDWLETRAYWARRESRVSSQATGTGVDRRRDDDRRRGARAARRRGAASSASGCPAPRANLARRTHAPNLVLVYESGTIGAKPEPAAAVHRRRRCWPRPPTRWSACRRSSTTGCSPAGSTSASSARRRSTGSRNINTTVIGGTTRSPKVRLPGAGGAPEIAASCREVIVVVRQSRAHLRRPASTSSPRSATATGPATASGSG